MVTFTGDDHVHGIGKLNEDAQEDSLGERAPALRFIAARTLAGGLSRAGLRGSHGTLGGSERASAAKSFAESGKAHLAACLPAMASERDRKFQSEVEQLTGMGFSKEDARAALEVRTSSPFATHHAAGQEDLPGRARLSAHQAGPHAARSGSAKARRQAVLRRHGRRSERSRPISGASTALLVAREASSASL